jgi:hypothetical protein
LAHGNQDTRADQAEWGRRLASRGILAILPDRRQATSLTMTVPTLEPHLADSGDFDWQVDSEDQLRILRWALAQSLAKAGPLAGEVDGDRLAIGGHSLGGSYAANAIAMSEREGPKLAAGLLLDNSTGPPGYDPAVVASSYRAPTVVLLSDPSTGPPANLCSVGQGPAQCAAVDNLPHSPAAAKNTFAALPASLPKLGVQVVGATHGEMEDPGFGDANPNVEHERLYERYGMAWLECWLRHDRSVVPYLNGPAAGADQSAGKILILTGSTHVTDYDCGTGRQSTAVGESSMTQVSMAALPNTKSAAPASTGLLLLLGLVGLGALGVGAGRAHRG